MREVELRDIDYYRGIINRSKSHSEVVEIRNKINEFHGNDEYSKLSELAEKKLEELKIRYQEIERARKK